MIGTSIAIIGAFLLLFAAFIVKDIVAAKRAVRRTVHYSVRESVGAYLMLFPRWRSSACSSCFPSSIRWGMRLRIIICCAPTTSGSSGSKILRTSSKT